MTEAQLKQLRALTLGGYDTYTALSGVTSPTDLLTICPDIREVAALMLDTLAAQASQVTSFQVGSIKVEQGGNGQMYRTQAAVLRGQLASSLRRPAYVSAPVIPS